MAQDILLVTDFKKELQISKLAFYSDTYATGAAGGQSV